MSRRACSTVVCTGACAGGRGVEGAKLLAKGFLVADAVLGRFQRATLAPARLTTSRVGIVAEIGRGEGQLDDPVAAVDGDALGVVRHARQVQVGHRDAAAAGQREGELHAAPVVEERAMARLGGQFDAEMGQHAMDDGDVMDHRRQEAAAEGAALRPRRASGRRLSRAALPSSLRASARSSAGRSLGQVIGRWSTKGSWSGSLTSTEMSRMSSTRDGRSSSARR